MYQALMIILKFRDKRARIEKSILVFWFSRKMIGDVSVKKIILILLCLFLTIGIFILARSTWFLGRTVDVVRKELDPQGLLRKYDWLKAAQASLDAKLSTIEVDNGKIKAMETSYTGVARNQWTETDAVQYNQW
jgi:hypothetical protein